MGTCEHGTSSMGEGGYQYCLVHNAADGGKSLVRKCH